MSICAGRPAGWGFYDEDEIDERIRGKIRNRMANGAYVFEADDT